MEWITNGIGRKIPVEFEGHKLRPFQGVYADKGGGPKAAPPIAACERWVNKLVDNLDIALDRCEIKDGMTISFHHHLRNGDYLVNIVLEKLAARGVKDLVVAATAVFPCHEPLIKLIEQGVISHIDGSMNGPLGRCCSLGKFRKAATLRSHGGRYRAVQDGDLHIDVAFIAAPSADPFGNANGVYGKSACGPIGFAKADSLYADKVVVVTDHLVPFPNFPWPIFGGDVDIVTTVDSLGDNTKIVSGTTVLTKSPIQLMIAEYAMEVIRRSGLLKEGFSFQSGAGGAALALVISLGAELKKQGIKAAFARGGSTKYLVELLNDGTVSYILEGQSFDLAAVQSLRDNPRHIETNPNTSYNYHSKGCFANLIDVGILGATEIDLHFNVNVNTHSDGYLLHGTGGFTDVAAGAKITMIIAPLFRKRFPIVVDEVVTVTTPGETVDVFVTERGVAINPKRQDLLDAMKGSPIPVKTIEELRDIAVKYTGTPRKPHYGDRIVAINEYRDGTVIDVIRQVIEEE